MRKAAGGEIPAPFEYPSWLGRWPAAAGLFAFASLELVVADGNKPQNLAIATLVYSALTWLAMSLWGVEPWTERGEAFSVYFNLFSRLSPSNGAAGSCSCAHPCRACRRSSRCPGRSRSWP
jgi:hypothetical protein